MRKMSKNEFLWMTALTLLCVACFPLNPLILSGLIDPAFILPLHISGWIFWAAGMVLIMAPIVMFPRRGGVAKGQSFVHTTQLVDTGLYAAVRHPQYLGGILAIFVATPLLYPHWLFVLLGIPGAIILYWSTVEEDKLLVRQFGDEYRSYMQRVPRVNIILGVIRIIRRHQLKQDDRHQGQ